MAHIVVLGAGLGGIPMAYEMKEQARKEDQITVISDSPTLGWEYASPFRRWNRLLSLPERLKPVI